MLILTSIVMLRILIPIFILIPLIELALLIKVGIFIGTFNTILLVIFTGILGAFLARLEGMRVYRQFQESLARGEVPADKMIDGFLILIGGIVLLTPGILTDALGFFLLIPWGRMLVKKILKDKFIARAQSRKRSGYYIEQ